MSSRAASLAVVLSMAMACSGASRSSDTPRTAASTASPGVDASPTNYVVARFTGSGSETTRSFTVSPGWELQFQINAGTMSIELLDGAGSPLARLVNNTGPGGGSLFPSQSGTVALKITAKTKWLVRVIGH